MKYAYISREVKIPADQKVSCKLDGKKVEVKGPKGMVARDFSHARNVELNMPSKDKITVEAKFPRKADMAMVGTVEGHIKNMIIGVTQGFKYKMVIAYAHFPVTCSVDKNKNIFEIKNFQGERGNRTVPIVGNVKITTTKDQVVIEGIDKEEVSLNAGRIQQCAKVFHKDRRIFQDGIYVFEKYAGESLFWHVKL
nr:50S ribosomal protein L6 [Candidatus Sigynarchaeota archaeon]